MNDMFRSLVSEIEVEADKLHTTPLALVDQLQKVVDRPGLKLPHTMRATLIMTMRAQFSPQPQG